MKRDLLTGEMFLPSHSNQKFACSENRIKYNNNKANKLRRRKAFINQPLHKNLKVLQDVVSDENEVKVHKEFLKGKGFNFGVHTHIIEFAGKNRYAVYNFIIIPQEKDHFKIIKLY